MIAAHDLHRQLAETHAKVAELGIALNDARAEVGRLRASIDAYIQRTVRAEERARCEAVTNAAVDEERRIADARVARAVAVGREATDIAVRAECRRAARIAESRGDPRMGRYIAGEIRKAAR